MGGAIEIERREGFVQLSNSPTQAKIGLEWATCPPTQDTSMACYLDHLP